jgi:uncharacterized membrane protein
VAVQLGLAALFMAVEPHLGTADAEAWPDWIAGVALAALTALAILALNDTRTEEQWTYFAIVALAVLGATAWRSAPAASAAVLAGMLALAGVAVWPGLTTPPDASLLAPALAGVLRLPDNVVSFLAFAALSTLSMGGIATLRLWRGRALPLPTAGLYTLAAVVPPLLALVLAHLRVTQFDRSIPFALFAVGLAAAFYLAADLFDRSAPAAGRGPAMSLVIGAFGSGVAAAMALAFTMALDRGYLTVAFAITALTTAIFAVVDRVPLLRYVVVVLGLVVLGRLAWDPRIMGAEVGTLPILNWLLIGYGVPAAAFLGAGYILKRQAEDAAARLSDALGVLLAALLVYFQIRHGLNDGDPFAPVSGHVEQGLFALMSLAFAAVLTRLDRGRANPVFRAASLLFGVISAGVIAMGLGLFENPLYTGETVRGPLVGSTLLLAYLVPGIAGLVLSRVARGARPDWYVTGAATLGLILIYGYAVLELRHAFHGEVIVFDKGASAPELGLLALIGIVLALALTWLDRFRPDPAFEASSLLFSVVSAIVIVAGLGFTENPLLTTYAVHGPVLLSTLLPAYLLPGVAAVALAVVARGVRPDWYATGAAALGAILIYGFAALELRHAFHGELVSLQQGTSAAETGLLALIGILLALALLGLNRLRPDPAFRTGSLLLGVASAVVTVVGLGFTVNPLLTTDPVHGPVGLSTLLPAYLLPGLAAAALVRAARGVHPSWYVMLAGAMALALLFGYVTLEVRHAFQGERLTLDLPASAPEVWSYSVAWLGLGLVFLLYGLWRGSTEARLVSAALVVLSVLKVFLYDLTGIGGFWRALSVICLGLVLIGIGLIYQKLIFARPATRREETPAEGSAPAE